MSVKISDCKLKKKPFGNSSEVNVGIFFGNARHEIVSSVSINKYELKKLIQLFKKRFYIFIIEFNIKKSYLYFDTGLICWLQHM